MSRRPWTDADTAELARMHGEGLSIHAIAHELGRSKSTVAKYARAAGLSFSERRARTVEATRAVEVDSKAKRATLESRLLDEAEKVLDQMWSPAIVFNIGGRDNTYTEHAMERPTFDQQRQIMGTAGMAIDRAVKLAQHDADRGAEGARSLLRDIGVWAGLMSADETGSVPGGS